MVPVAILHQVPAHRFDWLVPGLLRDKCIELIKTLPRQLRRPLVPIPDTVDRLLDGMQPEDRPLTAVLAERICRLTGQELPADAWQPQRLDAFYRMNYRLLDEAGAVLEESRDLGELKRKYRERVRATLRAPEGASRELAGLRSWDFAELSEAIEVARGGHQVRAYPGLVDEGESVALRLFDTPAAAAAVPGWACCVSLRARSPTR